MEAPPGIALVDDSVGGAYVFWEHKDPMEILGQHLDASGKPTWTTGGIPMTISWTGYQASPRAISDGAGGAIVVWLDGRTGICNTVLKGDCDIYAQRINATGARQWGPLGKSVTTALYNQGLFGIAMISDGTGGAYVAFQDDRVPLGGDTVYVQRVDGNGAPVWQADGVRIGQDPDNSNSASVDQIKLISDGAGGAIGAWYYTSYAGTPTISIRAQRVSSDGKVQWGT